MTTKIIRPKKILVFLPRAAADVIVTKLAERGHESVAISTVPEAFDALRSDHCSFAITTRPEIDLLRSIRPIPVVNLEIFFHAEPSGDGPLIMSKRFDGSAFMKRIEFLVQPKATRTEPAGVEQARMKECENVEHPDVDCGKGYVGFAAPARKIEGCSILREAS